MIAGLLHRESPEPFHPTAASPRFQQGNLTILADVRLDNRDDLCAQLGVAPADRAAIADADLIARAYKKWGTDCVPRLLGDFAFALWDDSRRMLLCARDHIGARPLYFAETPSGFAFASSIEALLSLLDSPPDYDEQHIARYLINPLLPFVHETFFRGVFKLPFGHFLTTDGKTSRLTRWWQPEQIPSQPDRPLSDYASELRMLVEQSVVDRLRATDPAGAPVGAHISGGLDSTTVAVLAQRHLQARGESLVRAYTWSPPVSDAYPLVERDERTRIEQIAAQERFTVGYTELTVDGVYNFWRRNMAIESPTDLYHEPLVAADAAVCGTRLMLSGWGGDEAATFNGRGYLPELFAHGRWLYLLRLHGNRQRWRPRRIALDFLSNTLPPLLPDRLYTPLFIRAAQKRIPPSMIDATFLADYTGKLPLPVRERLGTHRTMLALLNNGHLTNRLEGWSRLGQRHGITYAYPLLDRRVMEFIYSLPSHVFIQGNSYRHLFRLAFTGVLPDEIVWERLKYDPAGESQKAAMVIGVWQRLAREAQAGLWEGPHRWIDMPRLRSELVDVPEKLRAYHVMRYERIVNAIRVSALSR